MIHNKESVKEWIAVLTTGPTNPQTGINVVRNTIGEVTFTRIEQGVYNVLSDGLFKQNETTIMISQGFNHETVVRAYWATESQIVVQTVSADFNPDDFVLQQGAMEIRVYNQLNLNDV